MQIKLNAGITLDVSEDQGARILQGDEKSLLEVLCNPARCENGCWKFDGETYIPKHDINNPDGNISFDLNAAIDTTFCKYPMNMCFDSEI